MRYKLLAAIAVLALAGCASRGYAPPSNSDDGEREAATADAGDVTATDDGGQAPDTTRPDAGETDAEDGPDGSTDADRADADAGDNPATCTPDNDGVIQQDEVPLAAGLHATFRVATDVQVDTHGTEESDGTRTWDLSESMSGDHSLLYELQTVEDKWFAEDFPDATYAAKLTDQDEELGVFEVTDGEVLMLGVVSPEDGFTATRLEYDPPITLFEFPIDEDSTWSTDASVSGQYNGTPVAGISENYVTQVDASGEMVTPFGTFDVLRLRTKLDRQWGFSFPTTIRSFAFVAECFGTVATIRSKDNEDEVEFNEASEVWRLTR